MNRLEDVSQAILIGDIGWNTESEIKWARSYYKGEDFWNKNGFPYAYSQTELDILSPKKIPIHTYYIGNYAKSCFENISRQTNGTSQVWPSSHPNPS